MGSRSCAGRAGLLLGLAVLAASLSGCGAGGGSTSVTPSAPSSSSPSLAEQSNWPTFGHDMARSGMQALPTGITTSNVGTLKLNWSFADGVGFFGSPIVYDGMVYVVDHNGQMTALDESSGAIVWQQQLGLWIEQTPAIYDGILFVGNHDIPSNLYALDPQTGQILWKDIVPGGLKGSPVAVNGTLYEGLALGDPGFCSPGGVYTFNEQTGAAGPSWFTEPGGEADGGSVWSPITYDGANLYFGTGNTCNNTPTTANAIASINPTSLQLNWTDQTTNPLLDDDVGSGVFINQGVGYSIGKNGSLYAVKLSSGQILWSALLGTPDGFGGVTIPTMVGSTLVVSAGYSSAAEDAAKLDGFSLTGKLEWSIPTTDEVRGAISNGTVLFTELANSVAAVNPATGTVLWSYSTQGEFSGTPALTGGGLFAADLSGTLYAFALPSQLSQSTAAQRSRSALPAARLGFTRYTFKRPAFCVKSGGKGT